jgi:hypothetical protein
MGPDRAAEPPHGGARNKRVSAARQLYLQMMDELVTPQLADLGFVRRGRDFRYCSGDYLATFHQHTWNRNPPGEFNFQIHAGVSYMPEGTAWFWHHSATSLAQDHRAHVDHDRPAADRWVIYLDRPVQPAADDLLATIRDYGWPAIQTLLEDPGYPPDPARHWARTFPADLNRAGWAAARRELDHAYGLVPAGDPKKDRFFAEDVIDPVAGSRAHAMRDIAALASDDPRTLPAILNRLAADPASMVRECAAIALLGWAADDSVRTALRAAEALDEDFNVRWAARYTLRLARSAAAPA